jgi:O-antigen/teichoic acid export membrane protein
MDRTVRRRIFSGLGANIYNQFVTVAVQLISVPVLLNAWGTEGYGEWLILYAVPGFLVMTNLGFSQSAGNDMTAKVARGDRPGSLRVFQSLVALLCVIALAGMVLVAALLWWLPLDRWFRFQTMDTDVIRWVLWLLAAQVFLQLLDGATHAGFRANSEYARHVAFQATTRLLQFGGIWLAAILGGGPTAAAGAFFGVRFLATPIFALVLVLRHPWLSLGFSHASTRELRRLYRPALANMAIPLGNALNVQGMVLVVGAILGPVAVVVFSTVRTLTRLALQLVVVVSRAAEPELASAYGTGHRDQMTSLYVHALRGSLWLSLLAVLALAPLGTPILELWTQGKVAMNDALFVWLLASAVATALWNSPLAVLRAANRHLRAAVVFLLAATAAVGAAWLLLRSTGDLSYAGMALLLMDGLMAFYVLFAAARLVGVDRRRAMLSALNPLPIVRFLIRRWGMHS